MECNDVRTLLSAHVDDEVDLGQSLELDSHVRGCPECRAQLEVQKALKVAVGRGVTYFRAPAGLEAKVRAALPSSAGSGTTRARRLWHWPNLAAAAVSVVAVAFGLGAYLSLPTPDDRIGDEVVASHVRSMLASRTVDVASSDQHTVKPWFNGKLDYSPPVRDLTGEGFPLVGGRVDYIDHRPVAALVYRHAQHTINVFVLPVAGNAGNAVPRSATRHGFHTVHWTRGDMAYWAISDVDAGQLAKLAEMLREADGGR